MAKRFADRKNGSDVRSGVTRYDNIRFTNRKSQAMEMDVYSSAVRSLMIASFIRHMCANILRSALRN